MTTAAARGRVRGRAGRGASRPPRRPSPARPSAAPIGPPPARCDRARPSRSSASGRSSASSSPRSATCAARARSRDSRCRSGRVARREPRHRVPLGGADAGRHARRAALPSPARARSRVVPLLLLAGAAAALLHLLATNVFWHVVDPPGSRGTSSAMFFATLAFGGAARLATYLRDRRRDVGPRRLPRVAREGDPGLGARARSSCRRSSRR